MRRLVGGTLPQCTLWGIKFSPGCQNSGPSKKGWFPKRHTHVQRLGEYGAIPAIQLQHLFIITLNPGTREPVWRNCPFSMQNPPKGMQRMLHHTADCLYPRSAGSPSLPEQAHVRAIGKRYPHEDLCPVRNCLNVAPPASMTLKTNPKAPRFVVALSEPRVGPRVLPKVDHRLDVLTGLRVRRHGHQLGIPSAQKVVMPNCRKMTPEKKRRKKKTSDLTKKNEE